MGVNDYGLKLHLHFSLKRQQVRDGVGHEGEFSDFKMWPPEASGLPKWHGQIQKQEVEEKLEWELKKKMKKVEAKIFERRPSSQNSEEKKEMK